MDTDTSSSSGVLDAPAATIETPSATATASTTEAITWDNSPLARIYNPDGTQKEGAADALKELGFSDLSGVMLRNGAPFFDFAKQARDARATLSQKQEGVIKIPGADATPEQQAEFRKGLGALSTSDEYAQAMWPDDLPDGFVKDEGLAGLASAWAAENPVLTPASMKALTAKFIAFSEERVATYHQGLAAKAVESAKATREVLTTEFGGAEAFSKFTEQAKDFLGSAVAKQYGFDFKKDEYGKIHTTNELHQSMVNDPAFLRILKEVSGKHQPASLPGAGTSAIRSGDDSPRLKELIGKMSNGSMTTSERAEYNAARGIAAR